MLLSYIPYPYAILIYTILYILVIISIKLYNLITNFRKTYNILIFDILLFVTVTFNIFKLSKYLFNTKYQLIKNYSRIPKKQRCMVPALMHCPQKLGTVLRIFEQAPKKPNSARRKVARVKIKSTGRHISCHLPGEGHNLTKHATVLVRGGRCQDLIGVRYKPIRGKESFSALDKRITRLSKYGVKKKQRYTDIREALKQSIQLEYTKIPARTALRIDKKFSWWVTKSQVKNLTNSFFRYLNRCSV